MHSLDYKLKFYAISDSPPSHSPSHSLFELYDYQCIDYEQQFYVWLWYLVFSSLNKMCILCRFYDFQTFLFVAHKHFNWWRFYVTSRKLIKASCWWPFEHSHTLHYYYYDINKHKALPPLYIVSTHSSQSHPSSSDYLYKLAQ